MWLAVNLNNVSLVKTLVRSHRRQLERIGEDRAPDGTSPFTLALTKRSQEIVTSFIEEGLVTRKEALPQFLKYGFLYLVRRFWRDEEDRASDYFAEAIRSDKEEIIEFLLQRRMTEENRRKLGSFVEAHARNRKMFCLCGARARS